MFCINCVQYWDFCTLLRLLYITEPYVQYWDFCTVLRLLYSLRVQFESTDWKFSLRVKFESSVWEYSLYREHATYGCWLCSLSSNLSDHSPTYSEGRLEPLDTLSHSLILVIEMSRRHRLDMQYVSTSRTHSRFKSSSGKTNNFLSMISTKIIAPRSDYFEHTT